MSRFYTRDFRSNSEPFSLPQRGTELTGNCFSKALYSELTPLYSLLSLVLVLSKLLIDYLSLERPFEGQVDWEDGELVGGKSQARNWQCEEALYFSAWYLFG